MSKAVWAILALAQVGLVGAGLYLLAARPVPVESAPAPETSAAPGPTAVFRIALIPESDPFTIRRRYRALANYLSPRLDRRVELAMVSTYEGALADFAEDASRRADAAFLGSLVAVLAMDRHGARVLVKPEFPGNTATYRSVLIVREDSPIRAVRDLTGRTLAQVRTTTAGNLFPAWLLSGEGLLGSPQAPRILWVGTHDQAAFAVAEGRADAGALKDTRLEPLLRTHPDWKLRVLASGAPVPSNGLLVRRGLDEALGAALRKALLGMSDEPEGRKVLATLGVVKYVPCEAREYAPIYEMSAGLAGQWKQTGIGGLPPRRPVSRPAGGH